MKPIQFGIVGNMGPEADILFQNILRKKTVEGGASKDQNHIPTIVVKNPDIPDRSEAINEGGKNPVDEMLASIRVLENAGVQFAVMPCNTAHYFREILQNKTNIVLVDMLKAATDNIKKRNNNAIVGVLATTGTYNSGIYDTYLKKANIPYFKPNTEDQENFVHAAIYGAKTGTKSLTGQDIRKSEGIKSGKYQENALLLCEATGKLASEGVNTVILGCTELPIIRDILQKKFPNIIFIDPMEEVADLILDIYKKSSVAFDNLDKLSTTLENTETFNNIPNTLDDIVKYVALKAKSGFNN